VSAFAPDQRLRQAFDGRLKRRRILTREIHGVRRGGVEGWATRLRAASSISDSTLSLNPQGLVWNRAINGLRHQARDVRRQFG